MSDHSGSMVLGIVGGMFLAIGSILATVFCWGLPTDIGIDLHTKRVSGTVTKAAIDQHMRINRQHPLRISYTYDEAGKTYGDDHPTTDPDWQAAYGTIGVAIPLEIDSQRPERSRIEGSRHSFFGYGGALTLFFPAVGVAVLVGAAYTWLKESRSGAGSGGTAPRPEFRRARAQRDDRRK